MRVSDKVLYNTVTYNLQQNLDKLLKLHESASSGMRINRPSDDPIGVTKIIDYATAISKAEQYERNADNGIAFLSATESAISTAQDALLRAKELSLSALNGTYSATDRALMAKEVDQLYEEAIQVANTRHNGRYIFSGYNINTQPYNEIVVDSSNKAIRFTEGAGTYTASLTEGTYTANALASEIKRALEAANGSNTYTVSYDEASMKFIITNDAVNTDSLDILWENAATTAENILGFTATDHAAIAPGNSTTGDNTVETYAGTADPNGYIEVEIGTGTTIQINMPGYRVFGTATDGTDILATLDNLKTALENNDQAEIGALMSSLDAGMEQLNDARAEIGARMNRLDNAKGYLSDMKIDLMGYKSEAGDADMTQVITELTMQQNAVEMSRASAARVLQQSLLDFLK